MNPLSFNNSIAILTLICAAPVEAVRLAPADIEPLIQVRLYNYAGVPPRLLDDSIGDVERTYLLAGVRLEWAECPLSPDDAGKCASCGESLSPRSLVLRLLPEAMASRAPVGRNVFGLAAVADDTSLPNHASVFFDRVLDYSESEGWDSAPLLSSVMAHEIGHLLLGMDGHFETGLMRCPWSRNQIKEAGRGSLRFASPQIEQVRRQALSRCRQSGLRSMRRDFRRLSTARLTNFRISKANLAFLYAKRGTS